MNKEKENIQTNSHAPLSGVIGRNLSNDELEEGLIYWCNLSNRTVLVTSVSHEKFKNPFTGKVTDYKKVDALAFFNGVYDTIQVWDYMLAEYDR